MVQIYKKFLPLIGITIFIYLLSRIGVYKILNAISMIEIFYLIPAILFIPLIVILQTYKWNLLLDRQSINVNFKSLIKIWLIGFYYSVITPGKIGGFIKIVYLKEKTGEPLGRCSSNILLDRLLDTFAIFTLAIFGSFLFISYFLDFFWALFIIFSSLILLFSFFMNKERSRRILKWLYFFLPETFKKKAIHTFNSFYEKLPSQRKILPLYFLGVFNWVMIYSQAYIIAQAFSINVPYLNFILLLPIATVAVMMPITVGGLGTREITLIFLLSFFGVPPEKVFAFSILSMVIGSIFPAILGLYFALRE